MCSMFIALQLGSTPSMRATDYFYLLQRKFLIHKPQLLSARISLLHELFSRISLTAISFDV